MIRILTVFSLFLVPGLAHAAFPSIDAKWGAANADIEADSTYRGVIGAKGMVSADDLLAADWGTEIMRRGGNAVDAAVATAFMLAVTRPHYGALGGGGFMVICPKPKGETPTPCTTIDYREMAPASAHRDMYVVDGKPRTDLSQDGALASGVPGVTAGLLLALEKHGTMSRDKVLGKPILTARQGFRISGRFESVATMRWSAFNREAKKIFGCFNRAAKPGEEKLKPCGAGYLLRQPDLAKVLAEISKHGAKGFYEGWVADKLIAGLKQGGGTMVKEDLALYQAKFREPLIAKLGNLEIVSMGPPSSGGAILAMAMKYAQIADESGELDQGWNSAQSVHALTHALSLAFADRAKYFGDPDFVKVPLESMLSVPYLEGRWNGTFKRGRANLPAEAGEPTLAATFKHGLNGSDAGMSTTHFSVVDREGNAVALTTTVNDNFGSGFVPPGTGVVMNNEMDDFSIQPGTPNQFGLIGAEANAVAARKRPLSSMTPTVVRDEKGNARIAIGAQGGPRIASSTFLALINRLRFGLSIADAVSVPRFHHQWRPSELMLEQYGFPQELRDELKGRGYATKEVAASARMHAIERFPSSGKIWGVSDPRAEGGVSVE